LSSKKSSSFFVAFQECPLSMYITPSVHNKGKQSRHSSAAINNFASCLNKRDDDNVTMI